MLLHSGRILLCKVGIKNIWMHDPARNEKIETESFFIRLDILCSNSMMVMQGFKFCRMKKNAAREFDYQKCVASFSLNG